MNDIDALISKFLSGEATPDEAMQLEDWKSEDAANLKYYEVSFKVFAATAAEHKVAEIDSSAAWEKTKMNLSPSFNGRINKSYNQFLRIAATILLIVGISGIIFYVLRDNFNQATTYAASSASKNIILNDGTEIKISPFASITTDKAYGKGNRRIILNGSAYFSVVHKEDSPLVIDAGHVFIKDIGTKFDVYTSVNRDTIRVKVDEGVVLMFDSLGTEIMIKASERALYIKSSRKALSIPPTNSKGQFHFVDNKLIDVIAELNKVYNIQIVLSNKALEECRITTNFNNEQIETILTVVTETLGLSFDKTENGFLIKGDRCNK